MSGKQYRFLEVGELIQDGDEWIRKWLQESKNDIWERTTNGGMYVHKSGPNIYRRLIKESKSNEETDVSISTDRRETATDSSSDKSNRNRHITINKSDYCWNGSVDLTKQHCISVSVEEI